MVLTPAPVAPVAPAAPAPATATEERLLGGGGGGCGGFGGHWLVGGAEFTVMIGTLEALEVLVELVVGGTGGVKFGILEGLVLRLPLPLEG